jgi:hypothetical protein
LINKKGARRAPFSNSYTFKLFRNYFQIVFFQGGFQSYTANDAYGMSGYFQFDEFAFIFHEKSLYLQIGVKLSLGSVVGVRYVVTNSCSLSGYLTNSRHDFISVSSIRIP